MEPISLEARWADLMTSLGLDVEQTELQFANIIAAYSEKHRVYHNLNHLKHFFGELAVVPNVTPAMLLAVWYHDIVYKPGNKHNEAKSAKIALDAIDVLGLDPAIGMRTAQLIEATQSHEAVKGDIEACYFLDADMAILGSSMPTYLKYADAIRQEHGKIPAFLYRRGRKKFLQTLLVQDRLFHTELFYERYEQQAHINIVEELLQMG
jgi:predicted metal-dependent HD superfamily phosphohydrolase